MMRELKSEMMKSVICWLGLLFLLPGQLLAQKQVSESSLIQVFEKLRNHRGCVCENVKYTGSDMQKAGGGFVWQRGAGTGWTEGRRLVVEGVKPSEVKRIRDVFEEFLPFQYVNLSSESAAATYMEDSRTVYVYEYEPDAKRLNFLKATTDGEICVPRNWKEVSCLDASTSVQASPNPYAAAGSRELRLLGLSRLWAGVKQNFVFMERFPKNWDSIYVATIPQVLAARDDEECTRIFQRMAAQLGDGHTYVWGVSRHTETVPLRTRYIDGHVYIDAVLSETLRREGLRRSMELTAINGEPVLEYGERHIRPYVSSSTPQWTLHQVYDNAGLFACRKGDTLRLELKDGRRQLQVKVWPHPAEALQQPVVELKFLKGDVGYLKIRNFMAQNIKTLFDRLYPEILKTKALIIDVRDNGGGNSGNADYVLRHLTRDTIRTNSWRTPMYMPAYASWGYPSQWYSAPSGKLIPMRDRAVYDRPVVVLVNSGTFSAAEDFCSTFKGMKRGLLVGTPTGGSTGNGVRLELIPGKNYANICSKHDTGADGTEFVGVGILPDKEVKETYESFFKDKYDAAITAALEAVLPK